MTKITFKGNPIELAGDAVVVGDKVPEFTVIGNDLSEISSTDFNGKKRLISVVPSLDTGVCSTQTKRFNDVAKDEGVTVLTISNDLPFAQKRWCGQEGADHVVTLSDHRDLSFAKSFGVLMDDLRLLARSVFVIDENDTVVYVEYVNEGTDEPDYERAVEAIRAL